MTTSDKSIREKALEIIRANPGLTGPEIRDMIAVGGRYENCIVSRILTSLYRGGMVKRTRVKTSSAVTYAYEAVEGAAEQEQPTILDLLLYVINNSSTADSPMVAREIIEAAEVRYGIKAGTANTYLNTLFKSGRVARKLVSSRAVNDRNQTTPVYAYWVPSDQGATPAAQPAEPVIDWSKAPEDATHYLPASPEDYECWVKVGYSMRVGKQTAWFPDRTVEKDIATGKTIARPWDGTGLPPVGTVCEYRASYVGNQNQYAQCEILAHFEGENERCAAYVTTKHDGTRLVGQGTAKAFRHIRTPEQIAAEERERDIDGMVMSIGRYETIRDACEMLYDAGYRKQVAP